MALPFIASLLIGLASLFVSYVLMPKPKQPKPDAMRDQENPTAEAGREIPVIFGTVTLESPNVLHFTDKETQTLEIEA